MRLRDARLESSEQMNNADTFNHPTTLEHDRQIDISPAPHEPFRHHPDHGADLVVQPKVLLHAADIVPVDLGDVDEPDLAIF